MYLNLIKIKLDFTVIILLLAETASLQDYKIEQKVWHFKDKGSISLYVSNHLII